ncbi:concanavalin A-like lectin/glucanase [Schizopora paradoxa]|uniref:Concanavalin A-like lectin/glucanase n=1 Tax=Schizopora paradoxa TaxID=27342 RepID=A0A0H2R5F0_9AGAM|nr:concanavalin A-like lectin/glucanase [Schizopora paradoxa]
MYFFVFLVLLSPRFDFDWVSFLCDACVCFALVFVCSCSLTSPYLLLIGVSTPGTDAEGTTGSSFVLALPSKKEPLPSSALSRKLSVSDKPWLSVKDPWERHAWWATFLLALVGVLGGAALCFFGVKNVEKLGNLCQVMDEEFNDFDTTNTWFQQVELGGFGNGEFQMTTNSANNSFVQNGELFIVPTLTADVIGESAIFNGHTFNLSGCTSTNASACSSTSNVFTNAVIPPVQSARLTTQKSFSIAYGKVEVRAKLPKGDWLWPAIWMLPVNDTYGPWPASGEIDIMEARGNGPAYPAQGSNFVRSSLNWGPLPAVLGQAFGWQSEKRSTYADDFHTYTFEWDQDFMRFSVDSRLHAMLSLDFKGGAKNGFFERGGFPPTAINVSGGEEVVVQDPWEGRPNVAPFDQQFYLIINLAVGGTSGWFPDNVGGKMWADGSDIAMTNFAYAQSEWFATWPTDINERAFRIDSVKMWKTC